MAKRQAKNGKPLKSLKDFQAGYRLGMQDASKQKSHNGWTNYETWAVNLWLGNDEGSYRYWRQKAKESRVQARGERPKVEPAQVLAVALKDEIEYAMPELEGLWIDLLRAGFDEVNWYEIAQHLLEE